ncbi:MAG: hypothetical protein SOX92_02350 [Candidatus Onthovivens sp.]|jgi:hypothetical protein|nr:hypothetical protein [Candidatus Onthovivens sp.]
MLRLISDYGRWANSDCSMIFKYVVYLENENDALKYHLIDDDGNDLHVDVLKYIVV